MAFATVVFIVTYIGATPIAAQLSELALAAAFAAVIPVTENVSAMRFATIQQACAIVCRNPVANIVIAIRIAMCTLPYNAGKVSAS